MKKIITLLVFVIFTFTTSLIYAEDYNLLEISQQQKDKIDKVALKVETIINKQSTKEKKEKLKEKILEQLNDIFLKVAWKWDVDKLGIVNYLIDKIEAIWGASRYPWCSADDINIWWLLFSACNLWASTPNELWVKWSLDNNGRTGKFSIGESFSSDNFLTCAEWYTPMDDSMPGFISYLEKQNKNFLEELKVPNIDTWKTWIWNYMKKIEEFGSDYEKMEKFINDLNVIIESDKVNRFTLWNTGDGLFSDVFFEWVYNFPLGVRSSWWYTRCVKWQDFLSLRTQIDELINK